jgi:hypothetical protein
MVPLLANAIRGMYSHMFKLLSFKGYLQEKGSLTIDSEGSQDPTHSEELCNPGLIILTLF